MALDRDAPSSSCGVKTPVQRGGTSPELLLGHTQPLKCRASVPRPFRWPAVRRAGLAQAQAPITHRGAQPPAAGNTR